MEDILRKGRGEEVKRERSKSEEQNDWSNCDDWQADGPMEQLGGRVYHWQLRARVWSLG